MEVILLERVGKLGALGDTVKVKDGYARNFLIPQKKALRATEDNKAYFAERKAQIESDNAQKRDAAKAVGAKLDGKSFLLIRQAGEDGRLYGSVSAGDVAAAIQAEGVEVERSMIQLDTPIKAVGEHQIRVNLHGEVTATVKIRVAVNEAAAQAADEAAAAEQKKQSRAQETDGEPAAETAAAE